MGSDDNGPYNVQNNFLATCNKELNRQIRKRASSVWMLEKFVHFERFLLSYNTKRSDANRVRLFHEQTKQGTVRVPNILPSSNYVICI